MPRASFPEANMTSSLSVSSSLSAYVLQKHNPQLGHKIFAVLKKTFFPLVPDYGFFHWHSMPDKGGCFQQNLVKM